MVVYMGDPHHHYILHYSLNIVSYTLLNYLFKNDQPGHMIREQMSATMIEKAERIKAESEAVLQTDREQRGLVFFLFPFGLLRHLGIQFFRSSGVVLQ